MKTLSFDMQPGSAQRIRPLDGEALVTIHADDGFVYISTNDKQDRTSSVRINKADCEYRFHPGNKAFYLWLPSSAPATYGVSVLLEGEKVSAGPSLRARLRRS